MEVFENNDVIDHNTTSIMHALSGMLYMLTKVWLKYRIQGKFSRYIRWGGSVLPTNEPPSCRATKLYNLD